MNNQKKKENHSNRRHTGVGVLIMTNYNNKPHFVLGKERWKSLDYSKVREGLEIPIYEEFGGGLQNNKISLEKNATFELREETANLINITNPDILRRCPYFDIPFRKDRMYRIYILYLNNLNQYLKYFYDNLKIIKQNKKNNNINTENEKYYLDKSNFYLEMDYINLIPINEIISSINNKHNYICFNKDENKHNIKNEKGYKGILMVNENIFINRRLVEFLNSLYNGKTGLQHCVEYYQSCIINDMFVKNKNIKISTLKNNTKQFNDKYNFLIGTYSLNCN